MRGSGRQAVRRKWAADFAVVTAVGVLLGVIGPFGSFFQGPVWQRVAYWLAMAWLGFGLYAAARQMLERAPSRRATWSGLIALAALFSVGSAWVSWTAAHAMWPELAHVGWLTPAVWYGESLVICAVFALVFWRRRSVAVRPAAPATATRSLLGASPFEILCLQMEDHYVRVHTANGSRLVLATLGQAIEAVGRAPGLRVHRSWWVAERAVTGAAAEGRNLRLTLANGLSAPVARASIAAVRDAGWLKGLQASSS